MIKKYKDFFRMVQESKSGELYKYGCVMIYLNIDNWDEITSLIDEDDIYNKDEPILKMLYPSN